MTACASAMLCLREVLLKHMPLQSCLPREETQHCDLTWFTSAMLWITEREVMEHETDLKAGKRAEGR